MKAILFQSVLYVTCSSKFNVHFADEEAWVNKIRCKSVELTKNSYPSESSKICLAVTAPYKYKHRQRHAQAWFMQEFSCSPLVLNQKYFETLTEPYILSVFHLRYVDVNAVICYDLCVLKESSTSSSP